MWHFQESQTCLDRCLWLSSSADQNAEQTRKCKLHERWWERRGGDGRRLNNGEDEREVGRGGEGMKEALEECRVMGCFLHSCYIPLFFRLQTIATLSPMSEPEVAASAFHRQAAIHSSGSQYATKRQSRGPASPQECISYWFVSRLTHSELAYHPQISFSLPAIYTVPSSLPLCSSWLYLKCGESGEKEELGEAAYSA